MSRQRIQSLDTEIDRALRVEPKWFVFHPDMDPLLSDIAQDLIALYTEEVKRGVLFLSNGQ